MLSVGELRRVLSDASEVGGAGTLPATAEPSMLLSTTGRLRDTAPLHALRQSQAAPVPALSAGTPTAAAADSGALPAGAEAEQLASLLRSRQALTRGFSAGPSRS